MKSKTAIASLILSLIYIILLTITIIYFSLPNRIERVEGISSLLGLIFFTFPILILTCIPSLILGIISLKKIKNNKELTGKGLAITGIIVSSIPILIFLFVVILAILGN